MGSGGGEEVLGGASVKRTDLEGPVDEVGELRVLSRREVLRKEELDAILGLSVARVKSGEREGSLGWVMVGESTAEGP